MNMQKDQEKIQQSLSSNNFVTNPWIDNLDPATFYPPLDEARLLSIESGGLIKPELIHLIRNLIERDIKSWGEGFHKNLTEEIKQKDGFIYKHLGDVTFEKINNDILITVEELDNSLKQIKIAADGNIKANIVDPIKLQQVLTKIFQFNENSVKYSEILNGATMSLEYFRKSIKPKQENPGQELENYQSDTAHKQQLISLDYDIKSNFNEMPEINEIDRQKIFRDAYACVAKDFFDKASEQSQELFLALKNGRVIFLNDEDYQVFNNNHSSEAINQTTFAITFEKGLIVFNQELLIKEIAIPEIIELYNLIQRENFTLPKNQKEMIDLLAEYIPYLFRLTKKPIHPNFNNEKTPEIKQKDFLEQMLWSLIYHECLHVLSSATHFLQGLDEAATHYFTALATFKEKGATAFGIYLVLSGLGSSINWLSFIRNFKIDHQLAEAMYLNKNNEWTMEKMFNLFPNRKKDFYEVLIKG